MAPDLLLCPISDIGEALARVSHRKVVDTPPQHWIDQAYHPLNRLRPVSAKYLLELPQLTECREGPPAPARRRATAAGGSWKWNLKLSDCGPLDRQRDPASPTR